MTDPADDLMLGMVAQYSKERGYGFVNPSSATERRLGMVFIHASGCCVFEGSPELPRIGTQHAARGWAAQNVVSGHSRVIMRVVPGNSKGPRAIAWAIIPQ